MTDETNKREWLRKALGRSRLTDWLIVGLFLGLLIASCVQCILIFEANYVARRSANAAFDAAEAAHMSSTLAFETSRRQLQPYLFVSEITGDKTDADAVDFKIHLRNVGQTPAINLFFSFEFVYLNEESAMDRFWDYPLNDDETQSGIFAAPGNETILERTGQANLSGEEQKQHQMLNESLWLVGTVTGLDVFKERRWVRFLYKVEIDKDNKVRLIRAAQATTPDN